MAKSALSETEKISMNLETRDAAFALAEDLQHIRAIVAQDYPTSSDVRRLSAQLRRILVEGDLRKIASSRTGKIEIIGPDLRSAYRQNDKNPFLFLSGDVVTTHKVIMSAIVISEQNSPSHIPGYDPDATVPLPIEAFQNQRVLCFRGKWVTRSDIVKYVANVAHGVHSGSVRDPEHSLIKDIRHTISVSMTDGSPNVAISRVALEDRNFPIIGDPRKIDVALMCLISTGQYLTSSQSVLDLERSISEELSSN